MLNNQKSKFRLPDTIHYLNCAYMSPLLSEVEQAGHRAVSKKCFPHQITGEDFFTSSDNLRKAFASLIEAEDYRNIAIIPSVSYGIANVANNISLQKGDEILVVEEQFPSNIYSWQKLADKQQAQLVFAQAPQSQKGRGEKWNAQILKLITGKTKVIALPHVHWSDGSLFDLKAIRKKADEVNALLIIDGTQSVGALPFSVKDIRPDALICAGYKWLMGPYSIGLAYYSDKFCNGDPIEENWINRKNSENFAGLVNYEPEYQSKAGRFNVGELSNFTLTPMMLKAIEQVMQWRPENIQEYTKEISAEAISELQSLGCFVEEEKFRGNHLFGLYLPENINPEILKEAFAKNNIFVSFRGNAIRISPHLYNTEEDFEILVKAFKDSMPSRK